RTQGENLVPILVYLNGHYARTRGFEVEFEKRRQGGYWSGKVSYSYQQTKGKSSDPNEAKVAQLSEFSAAETRLSETFVRWNRPPRRAVPREAARRLGLAQADGPQPVSPGLLGTRVHAGVRSPLERDRRALLAQRSVPGHARHAPQSLLQARRPSARPEHRGP